MSAANGSLALSAVDTASVTADAGGLGLSLGAGGETGVAVSVGVSVALNTINDTVEAYVSSAPVQISSALQLSAQDAPSISTLAIGGAISAGIGEAGVAVAVAVTTSENEIDDTVEAYLNAVNNSADPAGGAVTLTATRDATITADVVAASVSIGVGGEAGVAVAGGGAQASNVILGNTEAFVNDSTLVAQGPVSIQSSDSSAVTALVAAVAASVGIGGAAGVGAAIGISVARNLIGAADSLLGADHIQEQ